MGKVADFKQSNCKTLQINAIILHQYIVFAHERGVGEATIR